MAVLWATIIGDLLYIKLDLVGLVHGPCMFSASTSQRFGRVDTPLRVEPPPSFNAPARPVDQTQEQQIKASIADLSVSRAFCGHGLQGNLFACYLRRTDCHGLHVCSPKTAE